MVNLALTPSVLLAVSSVLVDASIRSDQYLDRLRLQVLLWLAASLQKAPGDELTIVWIHVVFLSSVVSAATKAWTIRYRWSVASQDRPDLVRLIPLSVLVAVIHSFVGEVRSTSPSWQSSVALALCFFLVLGARRLHVHRRTLARKDLIGMPLVVSSFNLSSRSIDESCWLDWTPNEVLRWISTLSEDSSSVDWEDVCRTLIPERIPGSVLDTLTVVDLRSMGMPFGPASCLADEIKKLISRYPARRSRSYDPSLDMLEAEGWLTTENDRKPYYSAPLDSSLTHKDVGSLPQLDESVTKRAQELMHDRYGLELPQLRSGAGGSGETLQESATDRALEGQTPASTPSQNVTNKDLMEPFSGLPPELLESMPTDIRNIANRKPDLVRQRMELKRKQNGAPSVSQDLSPGERVRLSNQSYLKSRVGAQARSQLAGLSVQEDKRKADIAEESDMDEIDSDGERTGLLRKRGTGRSKKYASIR